MELPKGRHEHSERPSIKQVEQNHTPNESRHAWYARVHNFSTIDLVLLEFSNSGTDAHFVSGTQQF